MKKEKGSKHVITFFVPKEKSKNIYEEVRDFFDERISFACVNDISVKEDELATIYISFTLLEAYEMDRLRQALSCFFSLHDAIGISIEEDNILLAEYDIPSDFNTEDFIVDDGNLANPYVLAQRVRG